MCAYVCMRFNLLLKAQNTSITLLMRFKAMKVLIITLGLSDYLALFTSSQAVHWEQYGPQLLFLLWACLEEWLIR